MWFPGSWNTLAACLQCLTAYCPCCGTFQYPLRDNLKHCLRWRPISQSDPFTLAKKWRNMTLLSIWLTPTNGGWAGAHEQTHTSLSSWTTSGWWSPFPSQRADILSVKSQIPWPWAPTSTATKTTLLLLSSPPGGGAKGEYYHVISLGARASRPLLVCPKPGPGIRLGPLGCQSSRRNWILVIFTHKGVLNCFWLDLRSVCCGRR